MKLIDCIFSFILSLLDVLAELIETSDSKVELSHIIHSISVENWEELPPGGGVHAK